MEILTYLMPILCLIIGFYGGYKIGKGEKLPNPVNIPAKIEEIVEQRVEKKKNKEIATEVEAVLYNIEAFGTKKAQKKVGI